MKVDIFLHSGCQKGRILIKLLIFMSILGLGVGNVPSFAWMKNKTSASGVPLLKITYPFVPVDVDYAHLKRFFSPEVSKGGKNRMLDNCIFHGNLEFESDVYVTLTSGCPFENSFEIQFWSKKLRYGIFQVNDGKVTPMVVSNNHDQLVEVPLADRLPVAKMPEIDSSSYLRQAGGTKPTFIVNLAVNFDSNFKTLYPNPDDAYSSLRRIVAQAQNVFNWPTLNLNIRLNVVKEGEIKDRLKVDEVYLKTLGKYSADATVHTNAFLTFNNVTKGTVGVAFTGTVCGDVKYRSCIVEYHRSEVITGYTMAHEIGHTIGIRHDFDGKSQSRFTSDGLPCTRVGGVMDYFGEVKRWSPCSYQDFIAFLQSVNGTGKEFCLPQL